MSSAAGGDVRSFYAALGIELPGWAQRNATVRCFANPDAHAHEDRRPSCSVSLERGAWQCWACGARGGAYDAALARAHTPASAIALMVEHGLTERRPSVAAPRHRVRLAASPAPEARRHPAARVDLAVGEADVDAWHQALLSDDGRRWRELLWHRRLWRPEVARELQLGYDGRRITIPIRDRAGELRGVLRYRLRSGGPKMLAVPGTRLGLIPHPARERSPRILLVEGPPDMIAARSRGWPAIAVPGDHAWRAEWASMLEGRTVTVLMDCDAAGRDAARRIAADLRSNASVRVVDLSPTRHDGFDLTDWLLQQPHQRRSRCATSSSSTPTIRR
jgi:hypothetical protein